MALSITKATVGGSEDTWGTTTNTALDNIVSEINNNADGTNATTPNMTSLQIGGVAMTSTAAELNKLDGATVTTAEINILDGDTSATSTTVVDADRVVFNDDGTMKQVALSDIKTYINASAGSCSVTSVGLSAPTGLTVSGSPVTTSGTLALTFTSGYSIPTTSSQSNWDTAFSWGNHASAGYLTSAPAPTSAQVGSATAGLSVGDVGSYAFLGNTSQSTQVAGTTYAGSSYKYAGFLSVNSFNDDTAASINGATPSGTWRAMGTANNTSIRASSGLFLWIS
jgi:hypothetical protein